MGIFQRMFSGDAQSASTGNQYRKTSGSMAWHALSSEAALDRLLSNSYQRPVLLFKHSTRCSISSVALSRIEKGWAFAEGEVEPWFLDLIQFRSLSNAVAQRLQVPHQSPQVLLIKNGKAVYDASHGAIDVPSLQQALAA
jgi:bacillithiol system protein YtxJ